MAVRVGWTIRASFLAALVACGDGGGSSEEGRDGGSGGGSGNGENSGGSSDECDAMGRDVTEPDKFVLSNLTIAGDRLVFLSADPGFAVAPTIESVKLDGSDRTVLHTSTGKRRVRSVYALDDRVFFLEDNEDLVAKLELFQMPLGGGDVARLGNTESEDGYIFGVDDTHVHLVRNTIQPSGSVFERVAIEGGDLTVTATITGTGTPLHVTLAGDDAFFYAGIAGSAGATTPGSVYGFASSGSNVTPTALWQSGPEDPCGFPLGGLVATPQKLGCGFAGVATYSREGEGPTELIPRASSMPLNIVVESDGENLYMIETSDGTSRNARMKRTPSGESDVSVVVCDLGMVSNQLVDGFFPIAPEYEVAVGATDVFWIEQNREGSTVQYRLRAATK